MLSSSGWPRPALELANAPPQVVHLATTPPIAAVQASYSGVPSNRQSLYNLAYIEGSPEPYCEAVTFDKFPSIQGAGQDASVGYSTGCPGILQCGTTYLLRGFAHNVPDTDLKRSNFTEVQKFKTEGASQ